MDFFDHLGARIAHAWRAHHFDERAFPRLARSAVEETPPSRHVAYREVVDALLFGTLPAQPQKLDFGQPPIIVFSHPKFYIEVLCWMDGTTSIHQHAFSGVFHVMAGSSVHTRYEFALRERVNVGFLLGDVRFAGCELLRAGDTRTIESGDALIHGLFHLDRPSISVVVRTRHEADRAPQYEYFPPHVAVHSLEQNPIDTQRRQLLAVLLASDQEHFDHVVRRTLAESTLPEVYDVLRFVHLSACTEPFALDDAYLAETVAAARVRFGAEVDPMMTSIADTTRIADIAARRVDVTRPDLRFFLALLMNLPNRREIDRLVVEHMGGDPTERIEAWLRDLEHVSPDGTVSLLDVELGGDDPVALTKLLRAMLDPLLRGARGTALRARVRDALPSGFLDDVVQGVAALERTLLHGALRPLFIDDAPTPVRPGFACALGAELPALVPADATRPTADTHDLVVASDVILETHERPGPGATIPGGDALSAERPLLWVRDAGPGTLMPYVLEEEVRGPVLEMLRGDRSPDSLPAGVASVLCAAGVLTPRARQGERAARWQEQLHAAKEQLGRDSFAVLRGFLNPVQIAAIRRYLRALHEVGVFRPSDDQVEKRDVIHNEPLMRLLHQQMLATINAVVPAEVKLSYAYLAKYHPEAVLRRHVDRAQCQWNVSLVLDAEPETDARTAWPIYLEAGGRTHAVRLAMGDMVLYRGTEIPHWRDAQPAGHTCTICFFHFVAKSFEGSLE